MLWFPIYAAPALGPTVFIVRYCYAYIVSFFFDQLCRKMWDDLIGWQETNESQAKPHGKRNGWTIHVHTAKGAMPFIRRVWEQTAFLGKILCFFSPDTYLYQQQTVEIFSTRADWCLFAFKMWPLCRIRQTHFLVPTESGNAMFSQYLNNQTLLLIEMD